MREPDSAELAVLDLVVAGCVAILEFDLHDSTISPKTEDEDSDSFIDTFIGRILEDCRSSIPASQSKQVLKWTMIVVDTSLTAVLVCYLYTELRVSERPQAGSGHTALEFRPSNLGG